MTLNDNARLVEAILFLENVPLSVETISSMTGLSEADVNKALADISEIFFVDGHGSALVESEESYQFVPCTNLNERLKSCYSKKVDKRISKAAIETLAIIAYSQPVTRSEITKMRGGVKSDSIVRILREREFIKVVGRKDIEGHPCLYGTTRKFLYSFNLHSIEELPKPTQEAVKKITGKQEHEN
ncbi:MAG: SMC-Scp complex subunit ScpB [Sphaerochaetaceae bacterium]|nr:SMC-Scp complex subunit ScpB [Sphaerochaetaceae bacterium]